VALSALVTQRKELARNTDAIEREQANMIDLIWLSEGVRLSYDSSSGVTRMRPGQQVVVVVNNSKRPVRKLSAEGQDSSGSWVRPDLAGPSAVTSAGTRFAYQINDLTPYRTLRILHAGTRHGFVFDLDAVEDVGGYRIEFSDDAGLRWRIDQDLHLEKIKPARRPWYRRKAALGEATTS
jgi:hypothetical protein